VEGFLVFAEREDRFGSSLSFGSSLVPGSRWKLLILSPFNSERLSLFLFFVSEGGCGGGLCLGVEV